MIVVKPARHLELAADWMVEATGDLKPTIYSDGDWIGIELTATNPPSMDGRRVMLVIDDRDADDLLRRLRDRAIEIRRKTMEKTT